MVFSLFKKKQESKDKIDPYSFKDAFESVYGYFVDHNSKDLETARAEFINLTGQFDDEHENFNVKMDDFRNWFVFFYRHQDSPFYMLEKIKNSTELSYLYKPLSSGVLSIFQITKIRDDSIFLKDLIHKVNYQVIDSLQALSHEEGDYIQTSLFETASNQYTMALSVISHPKAARSFIQKKIKKLLKANKKDKDNLQKELIALLQSFMSMRYQLHKYKQISVDKIYSDNPPTKSGVSLP